ncbi:MAG TPA: hypothetical protein GXZ95_02910 [Mollicutes bacterium]|nr:hypothetical protein [Mollicutes bacterium]
MLGNEFDLFDTKTLREKESEDLLYISLVIIVTFDIYRSFVVIVFSLMLITT